MFNIEIGSPFGLAADVDQNLLGCGELTRLHLVHAADSAEDNVVPISSRLHVNPVRPAVERLSRLEVSEGWRRFPPPGRRWTGSAGCDFFAEAEVCGGVWIEIVAFP